MNYFHLTLFVFSLNAIHASIHSNQKVNIFSLLDELQDGKGDITPKRRGTMRYFHNKKHAKDRKSARNKANVLKSVRTHEQNLNIDGLQDGKGDIIPKRRDTMRYFHNKKQEDAKDRKSAQNKASVLKTVRTHEQNLNIGRDIASKFTGRQDKIGREYFHMDPVLNELRHRRTGFKRRKGSSDDSSSDSEEQFWMDQWDEHWMQKKFEALNSTQPRGDVVNMVAARPWGVPCGDPNQHDMPWGSCMLQAECEGEYRIFRGDYFCGRTPYVCCALLVTSYDMYQGLDLSFEGSSFQTDSNEKPSHSQKQKNDKKKRLAKKRKRKREREKRKKKIEKSIRKIIREIRTILTKSYRNGTAQRKKKTRELKRFIAILKKQYRKDRKSVVNVHEYELVNIDQKLLSKLDKIKGVNERYFANDTFRDIVVNGTVNRERLASFLRAHPDLASLFEHRRTGLNLKPGVVELDSKSEMDKPEKEEPESEKKNPKVLDYDIEYGMLYY